MKETAAKILFAVFDLCAIALSLAVAFYVRQWTEKYFVLPAPTDVFPYLQMNFVYAITLTVMFFEGIYTKRFDFWQEHKRIGRSLAIACLIILGFLALQKEMGIYSRFILIVSFGLMFILLPAEKYLIKRWFHRIGLWQREAAIVGNDPFFEKHAFGNPYLGYIKSDEDHAKTLFIASDYLKEGDIESIFDYGVKYKKEIIFVPLIKSYDFSDSYIIHVFNARSNLIVLENKLLDPFNRQLKRASDYLLVLVFLLPALLIMGLIALFIKREDPSKPVFFKQARMGLNGKAFVCYKFRTMHVNSDALLKSYLHNHPEEIENYEIFHKYAHDPRVTSVGAFLRKTSLDELPQIFNVLQGEMSLIGPRPYMLEEMEKIGDKLPIIAAAKPGITGLWQVSGRSDVDFFTRVAQDVWYVRNWSFWTDFVILVKTIKVVLRKEGAA